MSFLILWIAPQAQAEDGYRLWLRYDQVDDPGLLISYRQTLSSIVVQGKSETEKALTEELKNGLSGLLGQKIPFTELVEKGAVIVGSPSTSPLIAELHWTKKLKQQGPEGYLIQSTTFQGRKVIIIASKSPIGAFYGAFHF
ncbi:MAG TPA: alpha-glucuronidase family glycosyl hydrolase, partial [bacterium]